MEVLCIRRRLIANIRFFSYLNSKREKKRRMIKTTDCVLLTLLSLFLLTVILERVEIVLLKKKISAKNARSISIQSQLEKKAT